ncbi:hypothetical protein PENSPDRAFT_694634 [Peniophora sp. CONT]|nr:hypothetical protein PENSPDRAFT_694634 [Peniophora sp. CONT]
MPDSPTPSLDAVESLVAVDGSSETASNQRAHSDGDTSSQDDSPRRTPPRVIRRMPTIAALSSDDDIVYTHISPARQFFDGERRAYLERMLPAYEETHDNGDIWYSSIRDITEEYLNRFPEDVERAKQHHPDREIDDTRKIKHLFYTVSARIRAWIHNNIVLGLKPASARKAVGGGASGSG